MKKTFYAVEVFLYEITADVDANDVTIDAVNHPPKREPLASHYRGSFTRDDAQAVYHLCDRMLQNAAS